MFADESPAQPAQCAAKQQQAGRVLAGECFVMQVGQWPPGRTAQARGGGFTPLMG